MDATRKNRQRKSEHAPTSFDALLDAKIDARLAKVIGGSRWMRANTSPLGMRAIRRLIGDGQLRHARIGKFLLVDTDQHDALIAAKASEAEAVTEGGKRGEPDDVAAAFGVSPTKGGRAA
ncbi:MAG: hypothetical protein HYV09_40545 [Deltaproteobacteria bacterium]|nr:hypothetical protein [Deltaproteobacteria bacterium]